MYVFFFSTNEVPLNAPKGAKIPAYNSGATPKVDSTVSAPLKAPTIRPIPIPKAIQDQIDRRASPKDKTAANIAAFARKPAEDYLIKNGLQMNLPTGHVYYQDKDGPVDILIAADGPGKENLFLFSVKGKFAADKAPKYIKDYFEDTAQYNMKGDGQSYPNKGGFKEMVQFKGSNSDGEEFQAYAFYNEKTGTSHMLLLKERGLSRQPAKVRQIVDSVRRGISN